MRRTALDRLPRPALMEEARAASTKHNVALLICFGGNGRSAGFAPMVASKSARRRFVKELLALMDRYEFDGVDFNWEYPGYRFGTGYLPDAEVEKDYRGLMLILEETRAALGSDAPITMSYYPVRKRPVVSCTYCVKRHACIRAANFDVGYLYRMGGKNDFSRRAELQGQSTI